jgi:hypothetical protein
MPYKVQGSFFEKMLWSSPMTASGSTFPHRTSFMRWMCLMSTVKMAWLREPEGLFLTCPELPFFMLNFLLLFELQHSKNMLLYSTGWFMQSKQKLHTRFILAKCHHLTCFMFLVVVECPTRCLWPTSFDPQYSKHKFEVMVGWLI